MSADTQADRSRAKMVPGQSARRMSHQEKLKHPPPPLSPRTGRHINMPVS